jgi:hypothetical protein
MSSKNEAHSSNPSTASPPNKWILHVWDETVAQY